MTRARLPNSVVANWPVGVRGDAGEVTASLETADTTEPLAQDANAVVVSGGLDPDVPYHVPQGEPTPFGVPLSRGTPEDWGRPGREPLVPWEWTLLCDAEWGKEWTKRRSPVARAFRALWAAPLAKEIWLLALGQEVANEVNTHASLSYEWRRCLAFGYCRQKYCPAAKPQGLTLAELGDAWLENGLFQFFEGCQERWRVSLPKAGVEITTRLHAVARNNRSLRATAAFLGLVKPSAAVRPSGTRMELCFYELAMRAQEVRRLDCQASRDLLFLTLAVHAFATIERRGDLLTKDTSKETKKRAKHKKKRR